MIVGTGPYAEIRPAGKAPAEPAPQEMVDVFDVLEALGEA